MIKAEELSDEVVEAASKAAWETKYVGMNWLLDCSEKHKEQWRKRIRAALIAGLSAWPGAFPYAYHYYKSVSLILPLTQESNNGSD
jgi:hypothetical protein